jgi:hypothetical protein
MDAGVWFRVHSKVEPARKAGVFIPASNLAAAPWSPRFYLQNMQWDLTARGVLVKDMVWTATDGGFHDR